MLPQAVEWLKDIINPIQYLLEAHSFKWNANSTSSGVQDSNKAAAHMLRTTNLEWVYGVKSISTRADFFLRYQWKIHSVFFQASF